MIEDGLDARVLTRREEVSALAPEWEALLAESPCHRAFGAPAWYGAALRADPAVEPRVVTVRREGRLAAVLPLVQDPAGLAFAHRVLADVNDAVARPGDAAAVRAALAALLGEKAPILLAHLRANGACAAALEELAVPLRIVAERTCHFADLSAGWDAYWESRGTRLRKRLRNLANRAAAAGLAVRRLDAEAPCEAVVERFLDLHLARLRDQEIRSAFEDEAHRAAVRIALPDLIAQGRALILLLVRGEEIVGVDVSLLGAASLCGWSSGFDPALAHVSPGTLMTRAALEEAARGGWAEYDFLRGDHAYKREWATGARTAVTLEVEPQR